jgi:hypothetical protein
MPNNLNIKCGDFIEKIIYLFPAKAENAKFKMLNRGSGIFNANTESGTGRRYGVNDSKKPYSQVNSCAYQNFFVTLRAFAP